MAQDAAAELGFVLSYAASSLASGRHHNVGVVVPAVHRWFFSSVVDGVSSELIEAGYDLTLYTTSQNASHRATILTRLPAAQGLDAVIAVSLELTEAEMRPVDGHPPPGARDRRAPARS